jgi:polysaccharide biosynthesis protein PslF
MNITRNYQSVLQQQQEPLNVIYVSSYIPRMCGIATYTKDLTNAINLLNSRSLAEILAITRSDEEIEYPWESKFKIAHDDLNTYLAAAGYVNQSHADLVMLQHEYGLFGGLSGEYIVSFAEALERPLITTFHTVLAEPSGKEVEILQRLAAKSEAIVVMMNSAADMLVKHYNIDREKIVVIPHGVPDFVFNDTGVEKRKRQLTDRLVLGNINLLDPNKGIEYALEAVAEIAKKYPEVLYLVIGQTHPVLKKREDEKYRNFLKRRVRELGIEQNVRFINKYLPIKDLISWLKTIDVYVTPYLAPQQITSGALAYAIGAGKACVSTGYIYAQEVLAEDRGIIVPFRDAHAIAEAVIRLQEHPEEKRAMEKRAYAFGRLMTWPNVAQSYLNLSRFIAQKSAAKSEQPEPV